MESTGSRWLTTALALYLFVIGLGATLLIALNFPELRDNAVHFPKEGGQIVFVPNITVRSTEQGLVLLAFLAGVAGSFLHAAQSLASYLGNDQFKSSWTSWYMLRPWIGGILGFALYFAFRAGLVASSAGVNAFGVVAIGVLGGWFSKTTTDKLQEVFEILFKTDADRHRKDKLTPNGPPVIDSIDPKTITPAADALTIVGKRFPKNVLVEIDSQTLKATTVSEGRVTVNVRQLSPRPTGDVPLRVKDADASTAASAPVVVTFHADTT